MKQAISAISYMQTSFITTVYNEEDSIKRFLTSLSVQTVQPDEVIIVDAKSIDTTREIIREFITNGGYHTWKLLEKSGNRAVGRNYAISYANHEVILCSDAGCMLDKHWVERITQPFQDKSVDVVAGYYTATYNSVFEQSLATYTSVMRDRVNMNDFLPSSRSIAFRKEAWKDVKGYPEWLDYCEDLYFASQLKKSDKKFITQLDATVKWPQQKNIMRAARQFFNYAVGDGQAWYIRSQTPFLFGRYIVGLCLLVIFFSIKNTNVLIIMTIGLLGYILWAIKKNYRYVRKAQALFWLPLLQFVSDGAVISGMIVGVLRRNNRYEKKS